MYLKVPIYDYNVTDVHFCSYKKYQCFFQICLIFIELSNSNVSVLSPPVYCAGFFLLHFELEIDQQGLMRRDTFRIWA